MAQISSISTARAVYDLLTTDEDLLDVFNTIRAKDLLQALTQTRVIPVASEETEVLPYMVCRRVGLSPEHTKIGGPTADTVSISVDVYAKRYQDSIDLAEAVRAVLDQKSIDYTSDDGDVLHMRSCTLADSQEDWEADAYVQSLFFTIKI